MMAQVDTSQSGAQAQAAAAYQQSRTQFIVALSQAGYNASDYVLPANANQTSDQVMSTQQMQASMNQRSSAAAAVVGAITKDHRPMDYNNDKIAVIRERIQALQVRYKPDAKSRLPDDVFKRQVHDLQVRILNIKLSEATAANTASIESQLEILRADPLAIIVNDPLLFPEVK